MKKLGVIAGGGTLPSEVMKACIRQGRPFFVIALKGSCEAHLIPKEAEVKWVRLGAAGTMDRLFKKAGVEEIVLIGAVRRPSIWELFPDWFAFKFMVKVAVKTLGDDGFLRAIVVEIEKRGYKVVGMQDVLPDRIVQKKVYGKIKPSAADERDIKRGFEVAKALGKVDVGQAAIVQQGLVLAVEGIEGTDALIARSKGLRRRGGGGVLVKAFKPGQEKRIDLPTVGSRTVQGVHDAGLKGIAIEAGSSLIADPDAVVKLANKLGIFVVGI